ncbi:ABC transporter permease [Tropicimonas isoalkanivorans]|uniref:Ribose transport system permease protein n=1 Tax=Tropicimonas isoalkanivorans TaxID=441112 RepID=A0A1I1MR21_9RHOB|nr:ABC transporter permease [Tropicimonas isoalkanivorans]SFC87625.1 ribose transport system permease protein [Tropicimonas isoalkanivorans]
MTATFPSRGQVLSAAPTVFLILLTAIIVLASPGFFSGSTILVILADSVVLFTLAAGLSFVILLGSIDLSVPAVASLGGVIVAMLIPSIGLAAYPAAILAGAGAGLFSGLVHVLLRVPSFIATLATGGIVSGMALWLSSSRTVTIAGEYRHVLDPVIGDSFGIPRIILIGAVVCLIGVYIQRYTKFGRAIRAIGAGESAVRASGIHVGRQKLIAFTIAGAFAACGGALLAARMTSGNPAGAEQLLLPAIAAVLVGGTAITGGTGGVGRTVVGTLIVIVMRIGMTFMGVDVFAQQILFGSVLICAIALTLDRDLLQIVK